MAELAYVSPVSAVCLSIASLSWATLLSSCLYVADAPVSGRTHDVSVAGIQQAVIAAGNAPKNRSAYKVYSIEVRSRDEIYLYTTPDRTRFDYVKREKDGWRFQSDGLVLEHYIPTSGH